MTEKEYRNHPAISRSELFKLSESPEKFHYYRTHPMESTPALIFGQALHKMALEPTRFFDEFVVLPSLNRRTKEGKILYNNIMEKSEGKTVLSIEDFDKILEMCRALEAHPIAKKLLQGEREKPFFWVDEATGEPCKCRVDCIGEVDGELAIVDLKTALHADLERFTRDSLKHGYPLQAFMYSEGVRMTVGVLPQFYFVVIEKDPPYAINIFKVSDLYRQAGEDQFRELLGIYHDCKITCEWYGYLGRYGMIHELNLPDWMLSE